MQLMAKIHTKLGDLWWYTILLFFVQRFGDVINMFVGLWIVPKYVPTAELGAVLPLVGISNVIGIPLSIVSIPFLKFVAVFAEKRELGKVKAIIRDTFIGTAAFALVTVIAAHYLLPMFFERLRIANGSLALLLITTTIMFSVSCITLNAVSALKMFSKTIWYSSIAAPLRLVLMVVLMPFRPLSGYVVGNSATAIVNIIGPLFALRKFLMSGIKTESYWKKYGRTIVRYTWPLVLVSAVISITTNMDMLVIRHRLSEFDSAGYYIITRFSEISMQVGAAFSVFLLPMLAGKDGHDAESRKLMLHSILGVMGVGLAISAALWLFGRPLLSLKAEWASYSSLTPEMTGFAVISTLTMACSCITTAFTARSDFRFLWIWLPINAVKSIFLYSLTGYTFFGGILPETILSAIGEFNPCRLSVVMWTLLIANAAALALLGLLAFRKTRPAA